MGLGHRCRFIYCLKFPLIWILLVEVIGFYFGRAFYVNSLIGPFLCGLIGLLASWLCLKKYEGVLSNVFIGFLFLLSMSLMFFGYYKFRVPDLPNDYRDLPPREVVVSLAIMEVKFSEKNLFGIGRIVVTNKVAEYMIGREVRFMLRKPEEGESVVKGSIVKVNGVLSAISENDYYNESYKRYLKSSGILHEIRRGRVLREQKKTSFSRRFFKTVNVKLNEALTNGVVNEEGLPIYRAMLLGEKQVLVGAQKDAFQKTGTMHLFAISGLHICIVATLIGGSLFLLPISFQLKGVLGLVVLFCYVRVTGDSASALRAFFMVLFFVGSFIVARQYNAFGALVASAVIMLLLNPGQLWSLGFQLSYSVVMGILFYGVPLATFLQERFVLWRYLPEKSVSWLQRLVRWVWKNVLGSFGVSVSAVILSAPLVVCYFNIFTPSSVLVNVPLVFIATLVMGLGGFSIFIQGFGLSSVGCLLNQLSIHLIDLMTFFTSKAVVLPGAYFVMDEVSAFATYLTLGLLLAFLLMMELLKPLFVKWLGGAYRKTLLLFPPFTLIVYLIWQR